MSRKLTVDDVFSRGWRARSEHQYEVKGFCAEIAHGYSKQFLGTMVYSFENEWYHVMDGVCRHIKGLYGGFTGESLTGNKLRRYELYRFRIEQPPMFKDEDRIPTLRELASEAEKLKRQARDA